MFAKRLKLTVTGCLKPIKVFLREDTGLETGDLVETVLHDEIWSIPLRDNQLVWDISRLKLSFSLLSSVLKILSANLVLLNLLIPISFNILIEISKDIPVPSAKFSHENNKFCFNLLEVNCGEREELRYLSRIQNTELNKNLQERNLREIVL